MRHADLASVDTAFGVQIHHPQFVECVGAPESARLLDRCYGPPGRPPSGVATTKGRRAHVVELDGFTPICDCVTPHADGGSAHHVLPAAFPFGRPHRWKRWDFSALRLDWSGPDRILRSMAKTARVVSSVIRSDPVSGLYRSNWTNQQPVYATSGYY